jgi:DNA-binding LacI/PurR family transcriptional regulator
MSPSVKEVAKRAGVSLGTVSNVLNRPEVVAEPTRRRVLAAISELGFVRNESARQLRAGRSRSIGLVVLDVANPFFTDVARGAESVAEASGFVVMLSNSGEDVAREHRHLDHLEEQRVQGVLITPVESDSSRLDKLIARGIPAVLVDRGSGRPNRCSVAVDDVLGGRLAGAHLVEQGHRRTAAVAAGDGELRLVRTATLTVAEGRSAGARIARLPEADRPTAVFCANDLLALGVLQEMVGYGLQVPEDVAIVGYDDIEFAAAAAVPLSSVRQPREELGRTAMELLLEEIEDSGSSRHRHRQVVFEPELVARRSSRRG